MRLVKEFNALPCNVLWTALVSSSTDEEGNQFLMPAIQGKGGELAQSFASYMTSYGCMQVKVVPAKGQEGNPIEKDGKPVKKEIRQITWKDTGIIQGKGSYWRPFSLHKRFNIKRSTRINSIWTECSTYNN